MKESYSMDRRTAMAQVCGLSVALMSRLDVIGAAESRATTLGLVVYNCKHRREWMLQKDPSFDLFRPMDFLKHCRDVGAGGMQASIGVIDREAAESLRQFAETNSLFVEGIVAPPQNESDTDRFEAEIRTVAAVGAKAVRTVIMPGRRYEQFASYAEFQEFEQRGQRMLEIAEPIVRKHGVRLAVENHKDQRIDERIALFKHLDSEFIGACVDTGNSFALLDDPYGAIEAFAPYAFSVHLKDQALREYDDGFLLADIPLGQGSFDLKRMVAILRNAKPDIHFALELITRDPLRVPCLSEKYWAPMPNVPASDLSRALRFVRQHPAKDLQDVSFLSPEQTVALEDENVVASLRYARDELKM